jgi:hypothetical protein
MSSVRYDTPLRDTQEAVFRFLADPKTHGRSEPVERVDTAGAVVFLAGADAYKVKRAVKFPFRNWDIGLSSWYRFIIVETLSFGGPIGGRGGCGCAFRRNA